MSCWKETLQTIGAVLGILAAAGVILLQFQRVVAVLRSLAHCVCSIPQKVRQMLKRWKERRWAKELLPLWVVSGVGVLQVTQRATGFRLELPIEVDYTSRDNRYHTTVHRKDAVMYVFNEGRGRDSYPYKLHNTTLDTIELPPDEGKPVPVRYCFVGTEEGRPLLGTRTRCKLSSAGVVNLHNIAGDWALPSEVLESVCVSWESRNATP